MSEFLSSLLTTIGPIAIAGVVVAVWLVAHLSAAPGESVEALWGMVKYHKRGRKSSSSRGGSQGTSSGVVQGNWRQERMDSGAKYIYTASLEQNGSVVTGKASVTKIGTSDDYEQPFDVSGSEFAGYVILNLTSADKKSLSVATALLRISERGEKLEGQWVFRQRQGEGVQTESISWLRQAPTK